MRFAILSVVLFAAGFTMAGDASCVAYEFAPVLEVPIAELRPGATSINNHGEIVYMKRDAQDEWNVMSTQRGFVTFSTGSARSPDLNDSGEVAFADKNQWMVDGPGPFATHSTVQGYMGKGTAPSISNTGEIVFQDTQSWPRLLKSSTRGVIAWVVDWDLDRGGFHPEVNDHGEVVYEARAPDTLVLQIFSTERGQITFLTSEERPRNPTINNSGDIVYRVRDENRVYQLHSTVNGRLTDESTFPEPVQAGGWTGEEPFGLYTRGIFEHPDMNDLGQILFYRELVLGPVWDGEEDWVNADRWWELYLGTPAPDSDCDGIPDGSDDEHDDEYADEQPDDEYADDEDEDSDG